MNPSNFSVVKAFAANLNWDVVGMADVAGGVIAGPYVTFITEEGDIITLPLQTVRETYFQHYYEA